MEYVEGSIISRLDAITKEYPNHKAIIFGKKSITYGELKSLSKIYAHWLDSVGISELDRILVDLPRSDVEVIVQVALLRLGAIYVPRNTDISDVGQIAKDCCIRACIADQKELLGLEGIDTFVIPGALIESDLTLRYEDARSPEQPICILTTSGTTGKPKYLLLPSRSHVNLLINNWYCPFNSETRILYHSPASFDAATVEVWGALLNGGTLIVSQLKAFDIDLLHDEITHHEVNTLWLTSAVFSNVVNFRSDFFRQLSFVMTGGDTVSSSDVNKFKIAFPHINLVNCWGPAENGTFSTCAVFLENSLIEDPLQIGRPISGINVYLISDQGNIVTEPGITGRIYVSGQGLFLGYVRNSEIDLPLTIRDDVTEPLFDTGDYGEYSSNGNVQFFGRRDDLVKIGGKRVYLNSLSEKIVSEIDVDYCYSDAVGESSDKMIDLFVVANSGDRVDGGWHRYHDSAYESGLALKGNTDLYAGWVNPFTGNNIDFSHMDQWSNEYCSRVSMLGCNKYIDVGCGSGIFLSKNINIEKYLGIDVSAHAINFMKNRHIKDISSGRFELVTSDAMEFFKRGCLVKYDVVLLNSVITYLENKYAVRDLLVSIRDAVVARYLYLGDVVIDDRPIGGENTKYGKNTPPEMDYLHELVFSFTEIFSLIRSALGEIDVIFMPKLCADMNSVFRQRYDVLVRFKRKYTQKCIAVVNRIDLSEVSDFSMLASNTIIKIGGYDDYLNSLQRIREISEQLHSRDVKCLPFYDSPGRMTISLAISKDPYELVFSLRCLDLYMSPVCNDLQVSQRVDKAIRKLIGTAYPVRRVHLLYYLPFTNRGKIDRKLINKIENLATSTIGISPISRLLSLLNISSDQANVSMFDLGITSLHAMRIMLQLEHEFQVPFTTRTLFELGTVENIVDFIETQRSVQNI